jgi:hypothetical protein
MSATEQRPHPPAQQDLEQQLAEQRLLTKLAVSDLRHRWSKQPPRSTLLFGSGQPEEQRIEGNPQDAFHGVCVLNRTGKTVSLGFEAKGAVGSALTIPPGSGLVWAAEFRDLSLSALAEGPEESVVVLRLFYPPVQPMLFPYAPAKASVIHSAPADSTIKEASVPLLAANPLRLGMEIVNNGAKAVRLALGEAATQKHGLWLVSSGGTWNGQLSGALWLGSVAAICDSGETTVAVLEA